MPLYDITDRSLWESHNCDVCFAASMKYIRADREKFVEGCELVSTECFDGVIVKMCDVSICWEEYQPLKDFLWTLYVLYHIHKYISAALMD